MYKIMKAHLVSYRIGWPPSSVVVLRRRRRRRRRRPNSLNIFSSKNSIWNLTLIDLVISTRPIKVRLHMEFLWDGGTKVCSYGPVHVINMAAMPLYGQNLKKSSALEPKT